MAQIASHASVWTAVLLVLLTLAGCSRSSAPSQSTSSAARAQEMIATTYEVADGYETDEVEFLDPDVSTVQRAFSQCDWEDADRRPHLRLMRLHDGLFYFLLVGRRPDGDGYYAIWQGRQDGRSFLRVSPTLETRGEVISLLLSFYRRDSELASAIAWRDEWAPDNEASVSVTGE